MNPAADRPLGRYLPPLVQGVLALAAGILAGYRVPASHGSGPLVAALVLAAAALSVGSRRAARGGPRVGDGGRDGRGRSRARGILAFPPAAAALAAWAAAGLLLGAGAAARAADDCRARLPDGARVEVEFRAVAPVTDGRVPVRLEGVRLAGEAWPCAGTARARLAAAARHVELPGAAPMVGWGRWWAHPREGRWPTRPERAGMLALDSVRATAATGARPAPLLEARIAAQVRLRGLYGEGSALPEALLLAQRDGLDPGVRDRFARSGLTHLLAISGMHVGLIAGILLLLGRLFRLAHRPATLLAGGATLAYVVFLGLPHAATRAALQILLILGARLAQRPANTFALLAAAAVPLLVRDPLALLDPGFQLSFAGTAGILALRRRFLDAARGRLPAWLADPLLTGVAATLVTTPIAALHFGRVAPIGVLANLAALPFITAAVPAVAAALAASFVSWPAGAFLAGAGALLLQGLDFVASASARVPWGHVYVPRDAVLGWALAAAAAALLAGRLPGLRPAVRRVVLAGCVTALLIAWPIAAGRLGDGRLEIHAIDVGQGDAFALRSPAGRWLLVDVGPRSLTYDAGRARVVPYLLRRGVRRVDALVLTHPHADHIGGAEAVFEAFDVRAVLDPGLPAPSAMYVDVLGAARRAGRPWFAARAGREIAFDDLVLDVLYPDDHVLDVGDDANEVSVVIRLRYGEFSALFLGDSPAAVERELVARHGDALRAHVLKVGHHGSATSTSDALLEVAGPAVALISLGRRNRYGHPHRVVLERLAERDVRVWRTDEHGGITVRADAAGRVEVRASGG